MESCALGHGLILLLDKQEPGEQPREAPPYPSSRLAKGPRPAVVDPGGGPPIDPTEEGVGFGVPVLMFGRRAVFPGSARVTVERAAGRRVGGDGAPMGARAKKDGGQIKIRYQYHLDLVERLRIGGRNGPAIPAVDRVREALSSLHRTAPALRGGLDLASSALRRGLVTRASFERGCFPAVVEVVYTITPDEPTIDIHVDTRGASRPGLTAVSVMNELGASFFTRYQRMGDPPLEGADVGSWEPVDAAEAGFIAPQLRLAFVVGSAERGPGPGRLYRGREYDPGRLDWAGLAFELPPSATTFDYRIRLERV